MAFRKKLCLSCSGTGSTYDSITGIRKICFDCNGTGRIEEWYPDPPKKRNPPKVQEDKPDIPEKAQKKFFSLFGFLVIFSTVFFPAFHFAPSHLLTFSIVASIAALLGGFCWDTIVKILLWIFGIAAVLVTAFVVWVLYFSSK